MAGSSRLIAGERPDAGQDADQRAHQATDEAVPEHPGRERHREAEAEVLEGLEHGQNPKGPRGSGTLSSVSKR